MPPGGTEQLSQAITDMLSSLRNHLPVPLVGLPGPGVSLVSLTERTVGLGNQRGVETRGPFTVAALKGLRLDAVVRFQLWAPDPIQTETATTELKVDLIADRDLLLQSGFLRLMLETTSPAENISSAPSTWRQLTDYRILFEHRYRDTDGAQSLISQIPIEINNEHNETTSVTDAMIRWDNQAVPALEVSGGSPNAFHVNGLFILAFLPSGWDGNGVTVSASINGTVRERIFASVRAFRDAFTIEAETVELDGNQYQVGRLGFPNPDFPDPILVTGTDDTLSIRYSPPAFDSDGVVYLRVLD